WLTQARSTDWNNSLWVKIYPINGDGSQQVGDYIRDLDLDDFAAIETFIARESQKFGHSITRPVRMELGEEVHEQPPAMSKSPSALDVMLWSLKMRWWASDVTEAQDNPDPDVRIFVRYHTPRDDFVLENSVGLQKGMVGIVNAYASRRRAGANNVIIAHEFLHTLGATDKYDPATGLPAFPLGYAEPGKKPKFPQQYAEIMGGRIPLAEDDAVIPKSLRYVVIGELTAEEIRLAD
ncbi:MAG: hypothetical protein OEM63_15655, partial [Gammaproteobacteria bacterium]|nr:hypothetical protein [Gammaproteobacteria bacterium]